MTLDTPKIVSGRAWRRAREEGVPVELRPDWFVMMRPVTVDVLIRRGKIPMSLAGVATKRFQSGEGEFYEAPIDPNNPLAMTTELIAFATDVAREMFINPRIVDEAVSDDEIQPDDLTTADLGVILMLIDQPAEVLRQFRYKREGNVESVAAAEVHTSSSQPDIRAEEFSGTELPQDAGGVPLDGDGVQYGGDDAGDNHREHVAGDGGDGQRVTEETSAEIFPLGLAE